ncbi:MAG: UDP-N-acetylglucosamine 1-carboxyvinyltransferase [Chloroflexi bacterium]|nr:UDP-N-acetylglucosamine 1-carboxyvinyltransferase [Chloroflexota bacterium]
MDKLVIEGQIPLRGEVVVSGAKNAALPIMAAALLTTDECIIDNVPIVEDVRTLAEILRQVGCTVHLEPASHRVIIRAPEADELNPVVPSDLARRMRASFLLAGPLLARAGRVTAPHPGGCSIGRRPVNVDIKGFSAMGASVELSDSQYHLEAKRLRGERIYLDYPSHTGTENILMAATLAEGTTVIKHASVEPEVADLAECLRQMGARVTGVGTSYLRIEGVDRLHGVHYRVTPDRIEAGTYAIAAAITGGDITIHDIVPDHLDPLTHKLLEAGVLVEVEDRAYRVRGNGTLHAVELQTLHYPGFPTDLQAEFATLLTQSHGTSFVHERVFDDRFQYARELRKLGACIQVDGQTATIIGPTRLHGAVVEALDIRSGAALILAGLAAEGITEIHSIYHIDRGYENIDGKLRALGAHVERVTVS